MGLLGTAQTAELSGARDWPLDPAVAEALRRWRKLQPKGARFVFGETTLDEKGNEVPPNVEHLADALRADLAAVGVKRPELHATTKTRRRINAHDLRGVDGHTDPRESGREFGREVRPVDVTG